MPEEIEELVVSMKPSGIDETTESLAEVEGFTEETTENLREQSEQADTFADKFQGSLNVATSALAIAAGGLLSQVPVLGEAMSGLFALVDSIAFKMDSVLRPVISPITNLLFDLANAVGDMDGAFGKLIGIVATVAAIFAGTLFAPISLVTGALIAAAAGVTLLLSEFGLIEPIIDTIIGAFNLLKNLLTGDFESAWNQIENAVDTAMGAIEDAVDNAIDSISNTIQDTNFVDLGTDILSGIADGLLKTGEFLVSGAAGIGSAIVDTITDVDWIQEGKDLVSDIIEGINNKVSGIITAAKNVAAGIENFLPTVEDLKQFGKDIIDGFIQGVKDALQALKNLEIGDVLSGGGGSSGQSLNVPTNTDLPSGNGLGIGGVFGGGAGASGTTAQFATPRNGRTVIEVDGQTLGEVTDQRQRGFTSVRNIDG